MADFKKILEESAISILKQYPDILDQDQGVDQYSGYQLTRSLIKNSDDWYDRFYTYITRSVEEYENVLIRDGLIDDNFLNSFKDAFEQLKSFLKDEGDNAYKRFYGDKLYFDYLDEMLYLGIWDDDFTDDPEGLLSPYGKLLILLEPKYKGNRRIGILHAAEQHHGHIHKNNMNNAQKIANEIYNHFKDFADKNQLSNLNPGFQYGPIVQLCAGGAATLLGGLPVPSFIVMDKTKAHDLSGFSALPHECGHDIISTFEDSCLMKEIITKVEELRLPPPYGKFWEKWIEECLADAIAVAIIKEGEIHSLTNLFSNYHTNMIFKDVTGKKEDEHPIPYIRVLLAIEVGGLLGIGNDFLKKTKDEWIKFSKRINTDISYQSVKNLFNGKIYPMKNFVDGVKDIAKLLVSTPYYQINGKTVGDIFKEFDSQLVKNQLIPSILKTKKKWCEEK